MQSKPLLFVYCCFLCDICGGFPQGPYYPITASWFMDRYTTAEWDETLKNFSSIGGDTVVLKAPNVIIRGPDDIRRDPEFQWCGSSKSPSGVEPPDCVTEAEQDMGHFGLKIKAYATYLYEEDYSQKIIQCPQYEKMINSTRIYHRLVLPTNGNAGGSCDLPAGTDVMLLFTSFAGRDPHKALVQSAKTHNMSVYFGLPAAPMINPFTQELSADLMSAYYLFVNRVLTDHAYRYKFNMKAERDRLTIKANKGLFTNIVQMYQQHVAFDSKPVKDVVVGYYGGDETCLATLPSQEVSSEYTILKMYQNLGKIIHNYKKKFMVSPSIQLNKSGANYTLSQHVQGFGILAKTGVIDIIAVQEGRGAGRGCYYYDHEIDKLIAEVDPGLLKIVQYLDPKISSNVTYRQQFTGSNNQLFKMFSDARDNLTKNGTNFEFWLNVEALEYLRDDPCLPDVPSQSGLYERLDRTSKSRLDWALTVAGLYPSKVISWAWDSYFTCTTSRHSQSLADDILQDGGRPVIMYCGWHSPHNMSMVIIGHGLLGQLTQSYTIQYQTREGENKTASGVYGYYFETDWGIQHQRIASLIYTQFYDVMDPYDISMNGTVTVTSENVYHPCVSSYDFR